MITLSLQQGSPEWHTHRASHFNASDAPAMMGVSEYETRTQLMHRLKTGISAEVDSATQRRFDEGHNFEALVRPLAEQVIGETLYPQVGTVGNYSASFDGLTMDELKNFEHKRLNNYLRGVLSVAGCTGADLKLMYRIQMEQQHLVSGCDITLFMATNWQGDELLERHECWYESDLELRAQIIAGWEQFEIDLANYVPAEVVQAAVAAPVMALPAVFVQVTGELAIKDNLSLFEVAVKKYINDLPKKPATDQEFADADAGCKAMARAEDALAQVKAQTLGQVVSVDTVVRAADLLADLCRTTRLSLEKMVKSRKEAIRTEITQAAATAFAAHIIALNNRLGRPYMPTVQTGFTDVIKGKKTVESLQNAVDTELARAKIEANAVADKIQANLTTLEEQGSDYKHLFSDIATIVHKAPDDFEALVKTRVIDFMEAEGKRLEAEREKIRAEELAKIEAETITAVPSIRTSSGFAARSSAPVQATTRADINAILDTMAEVDLARTLHYLQSHFAQKAA